jgi:hypothetical protein
MRCADFVTPISPSHWDQRELSQDDGAADGRGDFLGAFDAETDMAITIADHHERLEAGSLTSSGLFLDGHDLHHFILQLGCRKKMVDDLIFLDRDGEQIDVF